MTFTEQLREALSAVDVNEIVRITDDLDQESAMLTIHEAARRLLRVIEGMPGAVMVAPINDEYELGRIDERNNLRAKILELMEGE